MKFVFVFTLTAALLFSGCASASSDAKKIDAVALKANGHTQGQSPSAQIPDALRTAVQRSKHIGQQLFRISNSSNENPSTLVTTARATAERSSVDRCDVPYRSIVLDEAENNASNIAVYLIASPPVTAGIMGGRHFRVETNSEGTQVVSVTPSTRGCLLIPTNQGLPAGATPVGVTISHVLSPAPTEFHVFLSLLHNKPVYVGTEVGTWKVDGGAISLIASR